MLDSLDSWRPRAHDLLRLQPECLPEPMREQDRRAIQHCLKKAPWAVVRRACSTPKHWPIGVRGDGREERYAAMIREQDVLTCVAPEQLRVEGLKEISAAIVTLLEMESRWEGLQFPWGPTGSVGFMLATGVECVHRDSDLDLIVRMDKAPEPGRLYELHASTLGLPCRVDVQVEVPAGAIALSELAVAQPSVLLRTARGPRLASVATCWEMPQRVHA